MNNTEKDLEKLKDFSIAELINGYALLAYAEEKSPNLIDIDYNEAKQDVINELKTRGQHDLVEYIISLTK